MKICVLGLDGATPEIIFGDERLTNLRRLMDLGVYGRLKSVVPPITVPAWMCMTSSQDPGSLGLYGLCNRQTHSYEKLGFANAASLEAKMIWDELDDKGKKSILAGGPPNYPPRKIKGSRVSCFLTPDPQKGDYTYPAHIRTAIQELAEDHPLVIKKFDADRKECFRDEIVSMSRKQWQLVHWLLREKEWDYFHFVDIGLDRIQHGFWHLFDGEHVHYEPGNPYQRVIPDYYAYLDEQVGRAIESLDPETILLIVSGHGAQRLDGGFAVNQWLIEQGLLVLEEPPQGVTPFDQLRIDWRKTQAWSEGGYYAPIFLNVQGREPQGVIPASDYESFRDGLKLKLESLPNDGDQPMHSQVFKPDEIYRNLRNVAPDLIVHFGELHWRSIGSVGHSSLHLQDDDTGPDGCNPSQYGMFVLVSPNNPLSGEYQGAGLLDMAPTLLDLAGHEIPETMQGRSLVGDVEKQQPRDADANEERIIHDRLAGLGYV